MSLFPHLRKKKPLQDSISRLSWWEKMNFLPPPHHNLQYQNESISYHVVFLLQTFDTDHISSKIIIYCIRCLAQATKKKHCTVQHIYINMTKVISLSLSVWETERQETEKTAPIILLFLQNKNFHFYIYCIKIFLFNQYKSKPLEMKMFIFFLVLF